MKKINAELRLQVLIAEYQFVAGLIPFYRDVEAKVLTTMGAILGGIAALEAGLAQADVQDYLAQGAVIALSSWLIVLFTAIECTAQLRILRAGKYISKVLYPELTKLVGKDSMNFETTKALTLIARDTDTLDDKILSNRLRKLFVTSAPLALGMGATGFVMPFVSLMWFSHLNFVEGPLGFFAVGLLGGLVSFGLGVFGYKLTVGVEHKKVNDDEPKKKGPKRSGNGSGKRTARTQG